MELTPYEKAVFARMDEINDGKVPADWPERDKLIAAIKKYIDCWRTFEFNSSYTKFRRIERINRVADRLTKINQI